MPGVVEEEEQDVRMSFQQLLEAVQVAMRGQPNRHCELDSYIWGPSEAVEDVRLRAELLAVVELRHGLAYAYGDVAPLVAQAQSVAAHSEADDRDHDGGDGACGAGAGAC